MSSVNINNQIEDAIKSINTLLKSADNDNLELIANQALVEAASLAMLNMVSQQQQLYMLQNAATTVAVKAMLETNPEEALKIMNQTIENNNITASLSDFEKVIRQISGKKK
ncbi:RebB family R body protein [uncultured Kordia sp.]|uniref:RebB family R body protein n=1 Tax=uncultured Kordia sp. TaxID=507699 RepID=UPI0026130B70|nr:RebB family R body protein [uncultured Kordia sp.]